jgi:FixJ family two-component response regulator
MLTGHPCVETATRSMNLGVYDYLTKPCKLSDLLKVILKAYETKQSRERLSGTSTVLESYVRHY